MDWVLRIEAAPHDKELRAEFDLWLGQSEDHRKAYRTMKHVWGRLSDLPLDDTVPTGTRPVSELPQSQGKRRFRRLAAVTAVALAACVALFFYPVLQIQLLADHVTSVAELRDFTLEDGSVVHLDAGSAIAVNYTGPRREVTLLSGQAFFEVVHAPDRPFAVIAEGVTVTVKGTAFGVRTWGEGVSVAVQSGIVEVSLDHGEHVAATLSPGQRLTVRRAGNRIDRGEIAPDDVASWRGRRLVVHDVTLAEVVEELGRHYHGAIILRNEALAQSVLTGVFDLSRPVEALNAIVQAQGGIVTQYTSYVMVISAR